MTRDSFWRTIFWPTTDLEPSLFALAALAAIQAWFTFVFYQWGQHEANHPILPWYMGICAVVNYTRLIYNLGRRSR